MFISIGRNTRRHEEAVDLVDLLLECHGRIRTFTGLAEALGRRSDAPASEIVEGCARCERYFTEALPLHVEDEERSVLPRLRGRDAELDRALEEMQHEHARHEASIAALLDASRALRERPEDRGRAEALAAAAVALGAELEAHLRHEEQLIFPAVRRFFSPADHLAAIGELRARRGG